MYMFLKTENVFTFSSVLLVLGKRDLVQNITLIRQCFVF